MDDRHGVRSVLGALVLGIGVFHGAPVLADGIPFQPGTGACDIDPIARACVVSHGGFGAFRGKVIRDLFKRFARERLHLPRLLRGDPDRGGRNSGSSRTQFSYGAVLAHGGTALTWDAQRQGNEFALRGTPDEFSSDGNAVAVRLDWRW